MALCCASSSRHVEAVSGARARSERALLMRAFIGDAVEQIENETVRASVWQAVDAALGGLS